MTKYKDSGMFNMPHTRGSDSVKICFSSYELTKKPIKYWTNCGTVHKNSSLKNIINTLKKIVGDRTANGICHLAYYGGSRVLFPFHVVWMPSLGKWEFTLYNSFGMPCLNISRKITSDSEKFTDEDVKLMNKHMVTEYHLVFDGYNFMKKNLVNPNGHVDIRAQIELIQEQLETK